MWVDRSDQGGEYSRRRKKFPTGIFSPAGISFSLWNILLPQKTTNQVGLSRKGRTTSDDIWQTRRQPQTGERNSRRKKFQSFIRPGISFKEIQVERNSSLTRLNRSVVVKKVGPRAQSSSFQPTTLRHYPSTLSPIFTCSSEEVSPSAR